MNINKKTFFLSIIILLFISFIMAMIVRNSVWTFEYKDIFNNCNNIIYYPYTNIEYSNNSFVNVSSIENGENLYKYIVKGKTTGKREVLMGTVVTEIEVIEVYSGNINNKLINIYEPIAVDSLDIYYLSTFEGCNFIKDNKEYILGLVDSNTEGIYMYATPFWGKFPIGYSKDDFKIVDKGIFDDGNEAKYSSYKDFEQIFESDEMKKKYFHEYQRIVNEISF